MPGHGVNRFDPLDTQRTSELTEISFLPGPVCLNGSYDRIAHRRRLSQFKASKRGFYSFWILRRCCWYAFSRVYRQRQADPDQLRRRIIRPRPETYRKPSSAAILKPKPITRPVCTGLIDERGWMVWPAIRFPMTQYLFLQTCTIKPRVKCSGHR